LKYPKVIDEAATLGRVVGGASIARFGDGELKLVYGRRCVSQLALPALQDELQALLRARAPATLVGIPTLNPESPKYALWSGMAGKWLPHLNDKAIYHSAFITRPDSAPWLGTPAYFDQIESLWKGQRVTFVGNGVRSLTPQFLLATGAKQVDWVECSYAHSYVDIDNLYRKVLAEGNHRVLLCAGPTATCLAERLARAGRHAIDLGHIGMFWRRYGEFAHWVEQREINKLSNQVEPNP
jgi:hypothetical protein